MADKPFSLGIMVGRFQTLHSGHESMVRTALALCEQVGVFVGSSQESGTAANPFSYHTRLGLLRLLFGEQVKVFPLPDIGVGNNSAWGEYVLGNVVAQFERRPDLLISAKESRRVHWFDGIEGWNVAELYLPKTVDISASQMRRFLLEDDRESWQRYTNEILWDQYAALRKMVLESRDNLETASL